MGALEGLGGVIGVIGRTGRGHWGALGGLGRGTGGHWDGLMGLLGYLGLLVGVAIRDPAPSVQVLDVSRNQIATLQGLPPLPRLRELRLDGNREMGARLWGAGKGGKGRGLTLGGGAYWLIGG